MSTHDAPRAVQDPRPHTERTIRCRECGHEVTHPRAALEVDGSHEHTFRNPAGYSFHVLLFREAPGCLCIGPPTTEATWFPGRAWSLGICAACHQHLGWCYGSFYGLIATRLVRV